MALTAKDFKELAHIARDFKGVCGATHVELATELADFAARHNPRFERERFLDDCEVEACEHCRRAAHVFNNMGVAWCEACNKPAQPS